jgi:hypothetical protein
MVLYMKQKKTLFLVFHKGVLKRNMSYCEKPLTMHIFYHIFIWIITILANTFASL